MILPDWKANILVTANPGKKNTAYETGPNFGFKNGYFKEKRDNTIKKYKISY